MNNSYLSFKQPLRALPASLVIVFFIVALLGFADSTYLTVEHYMGVIPPCTLVSGCEAVLTSAYSTIAGVPVSLLGALYYLVICVGVFAYLESKHIAQEVKAHHHAILKSVLYLTVLGFLMSMWFLYLQAFVIHFYCLYCLGSATSSTLLFIIALVIFIKDAKAPEEIEPAQTAAI
jgi:uncharacterized membrane protein